MWPQRSWEFRRHRKWSLNRQFQCKSMKNYQAQIPQKLAITKILSAKRAHSWKNYRAQTPQNLALTKISQKQAHPLTNIFGFVRFFRIFVMWYVSALSLPPTDGWPLLSRFIPGSWICPCLVTEEYVSFSCSGAAVCQACQYNGTPPGNCTLISEVSSAGDGTIFMSNFSNIIYQKGKDRSVVNPEFLRKVRWGEMSMSIFSNKDRRCL